MAGPRRGWVGARVGAACPGGPRPHRTLGRAAAPGGGGGPMGYRCPPLPPPWALGTGVSTLAGSARRRSCGPRFPGDPSPCASPPPPPAIAVTSRPRPCSSRLGLRAAAPADRRPRGRSPVSRGLFWGVDQGVEPLAGCTPRLRGPLREERTGFHGGSGGCGAMPWEPDTWLPPGSCLSFAA